MKEEKRLRGHIAYVAFFLSIAFTGVLWLYSHIRLAFLIEERYTIELVIDEEKRPREYNLLDMYYALEENGVRFPLIVLCQMYHEGTLGNDRGKLSKIAEGNKNTLGMKVNGRGYAINYPIDRNCKDYLPCVDCIHACYSTYDDGFKDYAEWQAIRIRDYENYYKKRVLTYEDYLDMFDSLVLGKQAYNSKGEKFRYAEDKKYTQTIRKVWIPRITRVLRYYDEDLILR